MQRYSIENMYNVVDSTVSADGLALLGARTSADIVMTKFGIRIYSEYVAESLHCKCISEYTFFLHLTEWKPGGRKSFMNKIIFTSENFMQICASFNNWWRGRHNASGALCWLRD